MFKWMIILFFIISPTNQQEHKFYLSLTDIVYDQQKERLEITSDVFIDDFQNLLEKRYQRNFLLEKGDEFNYTKKFIKKYLADKFSIRLESNQKQVKYLGKQYRDDKLRFYLYVNNVKPFDQIQITNKILMDLFEDQKNMIHVNNGSITKSLLLEKGRAEGLLKF
jgi:hypothetical protein